MKRILIMAISVLAISTGGIVDGHGAGSVCVAPVEKPATGDKSLSNPSGGNHVHIYAIRIDERPAVEVSTEHGVEVEGLSLETKHLIKVIGDGKNLTSFRFRFADYGSHDLCLIFKPLYETWSLTPAKGHGKRCSCR